MSEALRVIEFYRSMGTLAPGDVLSCRRDDKKLYSVVLQSFESGNEHWYELSKLSPFVGFEPYPHKVKLNHSGWLEDECGGIILTDEEWDSTEKGVAKEVLSLVVPKVLDERKEQVLRILIVGSNALREEAEEILALISKGVLSKEEAVDFLRRALT